MKIGGRPFVRSVPAELSNDGNTIIDLAHTLGGFFTRSDVAANLKWGEERTSDALRALAKDGLLLIDDPPEEFGNLMSGSGSGSGGKNVKREVLEARIKAKRIYWVPAVGMESAVEEFQRREGLAVVGFRGLHSIDSGAVLHSSSGG